MDKKELLPILFVDDEKNLLDGLKRHLRKNYKVFTGIGGEEGLKILEEHGPFPVVVSDMKMPNMNGAQFLKKARAMAPDTVRLLLTGQADFTETIEAVNEGNIYRFLHKPCPVPALIDNLEEAIRQHQLILDQRILLEETLRGSIDALTNVLSLTNPTAFGRASRTKKLIVELIEHLQIEESWHIEVAAMLSQIGSVTLPTEVIEKMYVGDPLTRYEQEMVDRLPEVTESLLANIPRIESVREIIHYQNARYDGSGPANDRKGEDLPLGSRILKLVMDFDTLLGATGHSQSAIETLKNREGWYDSRLLGAFIDNHEETDSQLNVQQLMLHQILIGMVFAKDVRTDEGKLLIARGQEVTPSLQARVRHWATNGILSGELTMIIPSKRLSMADMRNAPIMKG